MPVVGRGSLSLSLSLSLSRSLSLSLSLPLSLILALRASTDLQRGTILNPLRVPQFFPPRRSFSAMHVLARPPARPPSSRRNSICHTDGSFDNILPLDLYATRNEKINPPAEFLAQ